MRTAIEIVWWIGLLGALGPTAVIVKEALLIIRTLRRIHRLAVHTHVASKGIVVHLAPVPQLEGVGDMLRRVDEVIGKSAGALGSAASRLGGERRLE